jgi:predicted Zn-dependent protease
MNVTYTVGRIAFEAGDHRWAASLLQDVAKARAEDPEALFDFAQAAYSVGRVADAEANLHRCLELKGFTRQAAAERYLAMMSASASPAQAARQLPQIEQALRAEPTLLPALLAQAVAAENSSDSTTAQQRYEKLLGQFPDFTPAQRNLTILYAATSADVAKAGPLASKARLAFPNDVALARAVGILAYRQGEFTRAATLLQEVTSKSKDDGEVLYYLGMTQGRLNKRTESKQTLQRALEVGLKEALAAEAKKAIASAD